MADGFLTAVKVAGDFVFGQTAKTTPVDADTILISDSSASNIPKKMTFANLKVWILSWVGIGRYTESAEQTITPGGSLSIAHGLPSAPKFVIPILICKTAEFGYSVGNIVRADTPYSTSSLDDRGVGIEFSDATNLAIRYGSQNPTFLQVNKTTGSTVGLTNANWRLILRSFG